MSQCIACTKFSFDNAKSYHAGDARSMAFMGYGTCSHETQKGSHVTAEFNRNCQHHAERPATETDAARAYLMKARK